MRRLSLATATRAATIRRRKKGTFSYRCGNTGYERTTFDFHCFFLARNSWIPSEACDLQTRHSLRATDVKKCFPNENRYISVMNGGRGNNLSALWMFLLNSWFKTERMKLTGKFFLIDTGTLFSRIHILICVFEASITFVGHLLIFIFSIIHISSFSITKKRKNYVLIELFFPFVSNLAIQI